MLAKKKKKLWINTKYLRDETRESTILWKPNQWMMISYVSPTQHIDQFDFEC